MNIVPTAFVVFTQIMNLSVAVMAGGDAIGRAGGQNLVGFKLAEGPAGFGHSVLQETAPAAATIVVRAVGGHIDEIFCSHHRFGYIAQVFGHGIAKGLANQLARILDGEFYLTLFVPIRVDF